MVSQNEVNVAVFTVMIISQLALSGAKERIAALRVLSDV
jgi:hypothetical protein